MVNYADPLLNSIANRLQDPDPGIRRVAVMDLVDSPEEEAVQLLMMALGDSDEMVRLEAAKVIDEFDPSRHAGRPGRRPHLWRTNRCAMPLPSALADIKDKSMGASAHHGVAGRRALRFSRYFARA